MEQREKGKGEQHKQIPNSDGRESRLMPCNLDHTISSSTSTGDKEMYHDVTFIVGRGADEQIIPAHKFILRQRSNEFESLLTKNEAKRESSITHPGTLVIRLPDTNPTGFQILIKFVYTGKLGDINNIYDAMNTFRLAKQYGMSSLGEQCLEISKNLLTVDNAIEVYVFTSTYKVSPLDKEAKMYILRNGKKIIEDESFLQLQPKDLYEIIKDDYLQVDELRLFQIVVQWAAEHCKANSYSYRSLAYQKRLLTESKILDAIRFPLMDPLDFKNFVVPREILSEECVQKMQNFFDNSMDSAVRISIAREIKYSFKKRATHNVIGNVEPESTQAGPSNGVRAQNIEDGTSGSTTNPSKKEMLALLPAPAAQPVVEDKSSSSSHLSQISLTKRSLSFSSNDVPRQYKDIIPSSSTANPSTKKILPLLHTTLAVQSTVKDQWCPHMRSPISLPKQRSLQNQSYSRPGHHYKRERDSKSLDYRNRERTSPYRHVNPEKPGNASPKVEVSNVVKSESKPHFQVDFRNAWTCHSCGKVFGSLADLRYHKKTTTHEHEKRFRCFYRGCEKRYTTRKRLENHLINKKHYKMCHKK